VSIAPGDLSHVSSGDKARLLVEAIPYMRRFAGKIVVVKYGGNALYGSAGEESEALALFAEDIVLMHSVGMLPVVVHGGGPQIGEMMARLGKQPEFRDGLRVTDAETLEIVRMVLVGKVNRDIVGALNAHGALAVGLSGEDAGFITAQLRDEALGYVGDVAGIDPTLVLRLTREGLIPVVATIGADAQGQSYNINADTVAGELAGVLNAEKFVLLSDVAGVRSDKDDPQSLLSRLSADELEGFIASGVVKDGMVPKAEAIVSAVRQGVKSAHVLDGRIPHVLLLELFTDEGIGTMVTPI
jgi:acetylglutamate kinase